MVDELLCPTVKKADLPGKPVPLNRQPGVYLELLNPPQNSYPMIKEGPLEWLNLKAGQYHLV